MAKKKKIKKSRICFIVVLVCLLIGIGLGVYKGLKSPDVEEPEVEEKEAEPIRVVQIVDESSDARNIAVMFNNIDRVWGHQSGLQDAYIVYEMPVEGGYTRLLALYREASTERIGSVRSARPYYLDYVLENDAKYVHFGGSDQAFSDIRNLGINAIDGMRYGPGFWRDTTLRLPSEHTAFTSMERIMTGVSHFGHRTTSEHPLLLKYSVDPIDIASMEGAKEANNVFVEFSVSRSTVFTYNPERKVYMRSQGRGNGTPVNHVDAITGEQYTARNIIVYNVPFISLDSQGRLRIDNIGEGTAWLITDGYAVPITWEKRARGAQTIYRHTDMERTRIQVNDGNTYILIAPTGRRLSID